MFLLPLMILLGINASHTKGNQNDRTNHYLSKLQKRS